MHSRASEVLTSVFRIERLPPLNLSFVFNTQLTSLPHTLGALPALKTLHAHHNRIEVLPDAFFSLGALSDLSLNHNRMTAVPAAVHRLGALRRLSLHHNCLVALPRSIGGVGGGRLEVLEVSDNALTVLCPEISRVSHLTKLTVGCNPLLHPPQDVVRHGIDAIMEYLRRWGTEVRLLSLPPPGTLVLPTVACSIASPPSSMLASLSSWSCAYLPPKRRPTGFLLHRNCAKHTPVSRRHVSRHQGP